MVKQIRNQAFPIIFYTLCLAAFIFFMMPQGEASEESVITTSVTVDESTTIEQIAEIYNDGTMTNEEYVDWIIEENGLDPSHVVETDKIVVPIAQQ
ncbi:hypothetical protein [Exiguobacterium flavidum]|uniref:hypothetical protein n=1 Tax=Exiguobacterium flavidum TaxID=2184695 RepID=UPI000DF7D899|nr:hypothetical protein [Exiguobacterium flavidum]